MKYTHIIVFLIMLPIKQTNGGAPIHIQSNVTCREGQKRSGYYQYTGFSGVVCVGKKAPCEEAWRNNCKSSFHFLTCSGEGECVCRCCPAAGYCRRVTFGK
ncbi:uncharacterized protein LOC142767078 [Rhipicephalus microplus]|uniref:uncharacterized protein LOC142767078 n=1 Tax=Rhipicephalus microplus TaxID=6941 RepID=UPI003F6AD835